MSHNPIRRYPELFDCNWVLGAHDPDAWFSFGRGWQPLLEALFADLIVIAARDGPVRILDVKEKLGELRIRATGPAAAHERIQAATRASRHICEDCGRVSEVRSHAGWRTTLCDDCLREADA